MKAQPCEPTPVKSASNGERGHRTGCADACDLAPFERNHYFTGKLLVERDFSGEQQYYVDKFRLHHQRLHGTGVVCGLAVRQHGTPDCQARYLRIEPGLALDCCGREVLVPRECLIDLNDFKAFTDLKPGDGSPHTLQLLVAYEEDRIEEIPVLYDDLCCDQDGCQPNRIRESFCFDLRVDPPDAAEPEPHLPQLERRHTIALAHATHAVLDAANERLYVLASHEAGSALYAVCTRNHAVVGCFPFKAQALGLAFSAREGWVYVVTDAEPDCGHRNRLVHTIVGATLEYKYDPGSVAIPGSEGGRFDPADAATIPIDIAVAPDEDADLYILVHDQGTVYVWDAAARELSSPAPRCVCNRNDLGDDLAGLAVSESHVFVGDPQRGSVLVVERQTWTVARTIPLPPNGRAAAQLRQLRLTRSNGVEVLLVVSPDNGAVYAVTAPSTDQSPTRFTIDLRKDTPVAAAASPLGEWIYMLVRDSAGAGATSIRVANLRGIVQGKGVSIGPDRVEAGFDGRDIVVSGSGHTLYVPYFGLPSEPCGGGVAILDVFEQACEEILWRGTEQGCADCGPERGVVLATIVDYRPGLPILDQPDKAETKGEGEAGRPAEQPAGKDPYCDEVDEKARKASAYIDNRKGRQLVPSTQVLVDLVRCLMQQCGEPQSGSDTAGERGAKGEPGLGLHTDLPKILDIEWRHDKEHDIGDWQTTSQYEGACDDCRSEIEDRPDKPLLTVYFNEPMEESTINRQTFLVSIRYPQVLQGAFMGVYNLANLQLYGHLVKLGPHLTPHTKEQSKWSVAFVPDRNFWKHHRELLEGAWDGAGMEGACVELPTVHIEIKGDFIYRRCWGREVDDCDILDGDNLAGMVGQNRPRPGNELGGLNPSGDLVPGGDFESWFFLRPPTNWEGPTTGQEQTGAGTEPSSDQAAEQSPTQGQALAPGGEVVAPVAAVPPVQHKPRINLNKASVEAMDFLRGVAEDLPERIIQERDSGGRFGGKKAVMTRLSISQHSWDLISDRITLR